MTKIDVAPGAAATLLASRPDGIPLRKAMGLAEFEDVEAVRQIAGWRKRCDASIEATRARYGEGAETRQAVAQNEANFLQQAALCRGAAILRMHQAGRCRLASSASGFGGIEIPPGRFDRPPIPDQQGGLRDRWGGYVNVVVRPPHPPAPPPKAFEPPSHPVTPAAAEALLRGCAVSRVLRLSRVWDEVESGAAGFTGRRRDTRTVDRQIILPAWCARGRQVRISGAELATWLFADGTIFDDVTVEWPAPRPVAAPAPAEGKAAATPADTPDAAPEPSAKPPAARKKVRRGAPQKYKTMGVVRGFLESVCVNLGAEKVLAMGIGDLEVTVRNALEKKHEIPEKTQLRKWIDDFRDEKSAAKSASRSAVSH